jgi:hypothetical protein
MVGLWSPCLSLTSVGLAASSAFNIQNFNLPFFLSSLFSVFNKMSFLCYFSSSSLHPSKTPVFIAIVFGRLFVFWVFLNFPLKLYL